MRTMLLATVATFGLACGGAAMAQTTNNTMPALNDSMKVRPGHAPGDGMSQPTSTQASNIYGGDTRSQIAPTLPGSASPGINATAVQELGMAQRALREHRTGAAQEALERAETRLLDRSVPQGMTDRPSMNAVTATIAQAREALGHNDLASAQRLVAKAMAQTGAG